MGDRQRQPHYKAAQIIAEITPKAVLADALVHLLLRDDVEPGVSEVLKVIADVKYLPRESERTKRRMGMI